MEINTIKTRHIYKHLIGRKFKEPSSKFYFNRNFDLEGDFPWDNASVNSKHQHLPPRVTPNVLHSTASPGLGFILDDLLWGPGFCISIGIWIIPPWASYAVQTSGSIWKACKFDEMSYFG